MGKVRIRGGRQGGQTLIIFSLAMPLFLAVIALVVDGSNLMVNKRSLQVAADAASLAVSQSLTDPSADLSSIASYYSQKNGGPGGIVSCNDDSSKTNCYQTPYDDHKPGTDDSKLVEVRLTKGVSGFFASAIGLKGLFDVSARSVAANAPLIGTTTIPGTVIHGTTYEITYPGDTHTTTDPDEVSGGSGVGFAMSRRCDAITYGGDPKGQVVGAFATNGGLQFNGLGNPKHVFWLGFDQTRCPNNPSSPPSGTNQCTATAWGDATTSNNVCAKTLVNLNKNNTLPTNWPLTPPTPPTPRTGTWNASTDFGVNCIDLGSGNVTFTTSGHPPGVYCVNGPTARLSITNQGDLTSGAFDQGYTFFALGGGTISVSGGCPTPFCNQLKYYWPSGCGARPATRTASFTCFGRTITGYDPQTLLYATNPSADGTTCAICLSGNGNNLTGDIFAPMPNTFPPTLPPATGGALVSISGGGLAAGSGFIESWLLSLTGNTGSYTGTGTAIVIPGGTHTTTDPYTVSTFITPDSTTPDVVTGTTVGTDYELDE
jgi:hypothetical protein